MRGGGRPASVGLDPLDMQRHELHVPTAAHAQLPLDSTLVTAETADGCAVWCCAVLKQTGRMKRIRHTASVCVWEAPPIGPKRALAASPHSTRLVGSTSQEGRCTETHLSSQSEWEACACMLRDVPCKPHVCKHAALLASVLVVVLVQGAD